MFVALVDVIMGDDWQPHLFMALEQVWNYLDKPHPDKHLATYHCMGSPCPLSQTHLCQLAHMLRMFRFGA